jgi:hypothetical protein
MTPPDAAAEFAKRLQHVIRRSGVAPQVFVDQFARHAKLRKAVLTEYLAGMRAPYGANLDKLSDYLHRYVPGLTATDFSLDLEGFEKRVEELLAKPAAEGLILPVSVAPPTGRQMDALTGSYRLYRYGPGKPPTVISEAVAIERHRVSTSDQGIILRAQLWLPAEAGTRSYEGAVFVVGTQTHLVLRHAGENSEAMRFLTLHERPNGKSRMLVGVMLGSLDQQDEATSVTVALEFVSARPELARDETTWRSFNAFDDVSKEILLALAPAKSA